MTTRRISAEGSARAEAVTAILDGAEALLIAEGHQALTTRRLSEQAGVNHGLVHYYFGSMDEVMMQTLERFTGAPHRPATRDVRRRCAVPAKVAHGDELPRRGSGRWISEGMAGAAGAGLESARDARSGCPDDRRVAQPS